MSMAGLRLIAKSERLYRHIGRGRPGEHGFLMRPGDSVRAPTRQGPGNAPSRQATLADLCRRLVIESYAPAAVLINRKHECLYSLGPTERYLRVASGHATHDLLAMVRQDMRTRLRSAIQQASQEKVRVVVAGGSMNHNGIRFRSTSTSSRFGAMAMSCCWSALLTSRSTSRSAAAPPRQRDAFAGRRA